MEYSPMKAVVRLAMRVLLCSRFGALVTCAGCAMEVEDSPVAVTQAAIKNGETFSNPELGSVWTARWVDGELFGGCSTTMLNNLWATSAWHCYPPAGSGWTHLPAESEANWVTTYRPANGHEWHIRSGGTRNAPTQTRNIRRMYAYPGNTSDTNQPGGHFVDIVLFELETPWRHGSQVYDWQLPLWPGSTSSMNGRSARCLGWGGGSDQLQGGDFNLVVGAGDTPDNWNNIYFGDAVWAHPADEDVYHEGGDSGGGCFVRQNSVDYQISVFRDGGGEVGAAARGLSTATSNLTTGRPGVRQWIDHILHGPAVDLGEAMQGPPGVTSQARGRLDVFWVETGTGNLIRGPYDNGWLANQALGKPSGRTLATNRLGAESWASGRVDVFARTTNGELWQRFAENNTFVPGWFQLTIPTTTVTSGPALASWGTGRLDLFARGPNGEVRHAYYDQGWAGVWESLEGNIVGEPAAVSWGSGRIDVFARASNGRIIHKWFDNGWQPCFQGCAWEDLGGSMSSPPTAASWRSGRLDVYARGTNGRLMHRWYQGSWVNEWIDTGISVPSTPSATSWGRGRIDVFSRTSSGTQWQVHYKGHR